MSDDDDSENTAFIAEQIEYWLRLDDEEEDNNGEGSHDETHDDKKGDDEEEGEDEESLTNENEEDDFNNNGDGENKRDSGSMSNSESVSDSVNQCFDSSALNNESEKYNNDNNKDAFRNLFMAEMTKIKNRLRQAEEDLVLLRLEKSYTPKPFLALRKERQQTKTEISALCADLREIATLPQTTNAKKVQKQLKREALLQKTVLLRFLDAKMAAM